MKGFTITMKIDVDLEGLPPEKVEEIIRLGLCEEIARELREEVQDDMMIPSQFEDRVKITVEVEEHG